MNQEIFEVAGTIEKGRLKIGNLDLFKEVMQRFLDGPVVITVKRDRPQRTSAQNRFWHGFVIPLFADHCGYEFDEMKDALSLKLIPKEVIDLDTGEVRIVPGHTSDLNTKEFADLIERAQRLGAEMGIDIPSPGETEAA